MVMQFGNKFIIPLTQSVCPWGSWRGMKWNLPFRRKLRGKRCNARPVCNYKARVISQL